MNGFVLTKDLLFLLSPLLLLQTSLVVYCGFVIFKEGVRNLSKGAWLLLCLFINVIGPVLFFLLGRKEVE